MSLARPLFWRKSDGHPQDGEEGRWVADGLSGRYHADKQRDGTWLLWWAHDNFIWEASATFAEVKEKAEADWQKRFREQMTVDLLGEKTAPWPSDTPRPTASSTDAPDRVGEGATAEASRKAEQQWAEASRKAEQQWAEAYPDRAARLQRVLAMYRFDTVEDRARAHEVGRVLLSGNPDARVGEGEREDVERDIAGETVCGFRVAAYRETHPEHGSKYGHRYSEHWSTPNSRDPRVRIERLFTEEQLRAALDTPRAIDTDGLGGEERA